MILCDVFYSNDVHRSLLGSNRSRTQEMDFRQCPSGNKDFIKESSSRPALLLNPGRKLNNSETRKKGSATASGRKHAIIRYQCEYCPKAFTLNTDRESYESVHTGIYKFSCQVCGKGFNRNDQLNKHYKTHK